MSRLVCFAWILPGVFNLAVAAEPPAPAPAAKTPMSAEECGVWEREQSFAASVEAHDAAAFRAHLHPDTVFIDGRGGLTRGADAVTESWAGIISGEELVLRWYPDVVTIAGTTGVALSRGPYWIENTKADADPRFMVGQFISTWLRGADGQWQVVFDGGGGGRPQPATAEQVTALKAGLAKSCPAS